MAMRLLGFCLGLIVVGPIPLHGQDLDAADIQVTLDAALPLALATAAKAFPDLPRYLLYSIGPRALKGVREGCTGRCAGRTEPSPPAMAGGTRLYERRPCGRDPTGRRAESTHR